MSRCKQKLLLLETNLTMASSSKYVFVEWESDSTVSVVSTSCLKTRDGECVTQSWPGGVYAGTILQEGGTKGDVHVNNLHNRYQGV